ncbi:MAG TPA: hypothetical protein VM240_10225 [Verrucomicrobiae bacterium]|nr:hypothetical protein [Verrucomicrobiae bacterium]
MKRSILAWRVAPLLLAAGWATGVSARDPYVLDIAVTNGQGGTETGTFGYSSIDEAIDRFDTSQLARDFNYGGFEQVDVDFDLRGIGAVLRFNQDATGLTFFINDVNIDPSDADGDGTNKVSFDGGSREASIQLLKEFLKNNKSALRELLTAFARFSPIDPLAGNPDSLFSRRMRDDFSYGFTNKVSQIWGCGTSAFNTTNDAPIQVAAVGGVSDIFADAQARAAALQAQNEMGIGLLASSTTAKSAGGDYATIGLVVPLSYTAKLDSDPRKKIRFDLPITYTDTEGAVSYSLGAGLAYTHPLADEWSLTPAIGVGATGSEDLGSGGGLSALSLTSAYTWRLDSFALSMGNSVGRYEALGLKFGDVEAEADISNTVFTNGFLLTGPNSLIAKNLVVEYSFVDTRITGDEVYADAYDEIGIALGHINTTMGVIDSYTKVGLSYLIADGAAGDISSLRLNLSARF